MKLSNNEFRCVYELVKPGEVFEWEGTLLYQTSRGPVFLRTGTPVAAELVSSDEVVIYVDACAVLTGR